MSVAGVVKNSLMVLTHLILNDMMKVRSHVSRLALCLLDTNPRITALAQLFFHEFSRKAYKVSWFQNPIFVFTAVIDELFISKL